MNKMIFSTASLWLALAATSGTAIADAQSAEGALTLDAAAIKAEGIVTAPAAVRRLQGEIKAPGEVKANGYATVLVSPRVPAQVVKRQARLGDSVKAGAPLVALSSVEVAEAQGALIVGEREWQRVSSLGPQAVSERRYTEVKVQRDQARARLRAYGLSDGQVTALLRGGSSRADGTFELLAPTDGRITTDEFMLGERIEPGRTLFTLVDEDSVWVQAQLSPADAVRVLRGSAARIEAHGQTISGKVVQLPHQASEQTRTVPVRIEASNRDDLLHNGEFVDTFIAAGEGRDALAVPDEAVLLMQNQPTVFVAVGQGRFDPVPVATGDSQGGWTVIRDGLRPGAAVVVKGAFALKARLLKSQIGGDGH
ncbi:membrane fusion protein, cobalt-zinc-cadmium efflux system [Dyella sp. OK004]|uniref:efflux RND transporter periplasmic adaptor subunit n=1 Tax=Dyella sp. OK004 TaxID=1855292 RepID=UPI0008E27264|nr:efflux RND transporter periplasmic adaptor subunit [Dyella sp. OK004]SFS05214.1 membrane fusion protein, cobalt-zinc-cadmium efflux system [Dyella sp. OK004]